MDRSDKPAQQRRPRRRSRHWAEFVKDEPLTVLAVAATAGFVIGGGANTHAGRSMLLLIGRILAPGALLNLAANMATGNHDRTRRAEFQN